MLSLVKVKARSNQDSIKKNSNINQDNKKTKKFFSSLNTKTCNNSNLNKLHNMDNATKGLINYKEKYKKMFFGKDYYDERFFDSRNHRCFFSIFHAKIGTYILCTLILHEIVLGMLFLLTQLESKEWTLKIAIIFLFRLIQLPSITLLYIALWKFQSHLIIPFAITQITFGVFADITTLIMIIEKLEKNNFSIIFNNKFTWLKFLIPLVIYFFFIIGLMWVLYKCFIFLRARSLHNAKRCAEKNEEFILKQSLDNNSDENNYWEKNLCSENEELQKTELQRNSLDWNSLITKPKAFSTQPLYINNSDFLINKKNSKQIQTTASDLALSKQYENVENKIGTDYNKCQSSTIPIQLLNNLNQAKTQKRRAMTRLFNNKSRDFEATMFLIKQKNSRNLCRFKGSVYSLQETLRHHMTFNKSNSSITTSSNDQTLNDTQNSENSNNCDQKFTTNLENFSNSSSTLIEPIVPKINLFKNNDSKNKLKKNSIVNKNLPKVLNNNNN